MPLGCHRRRIADRVIFDKLLQVLRFGCSYEGITDASCSAITLRERRDEWIRLGIFTDLRQIVLETYDRIVGLALSDIARVHHRSTGRWPMRRPKPRRSRKTGHETLIDGRWERHPPRPGPGRSQPA